MIDRKPVWINGRLVYLLPWARGWDALLAASEEDFRDVWRGRACLTDQFGRTVSPDDDVRSGQKLTVLRADPALELLAGGRPDPRAASS